MKVSTIAILASTVTAATAAHPRRVRKGAASRRSSIRRHLQDKEAPENEAPAPEGTPEAPLVEEMSLSLGLDVETTIAATTVAPEPVEPENLFDVETTAAPEEPAKEEDVVTTVAPELNKEEEDELVEEMSVPEEELSVPEEEEEEAVKEEDVEPATTEAPKEEDPVEEEMSVPEEEMSMPEAETTVPPPEEPEEDDEPAKEEDPEEDDEPAKEDEETITETTVAPVIIEEMSLSMSMSMQEWDMSMEGIVDDQPQFVFDGDDDQSFDEEITGDDAAVDPVTGDNDESGSVILGSSIAALFITAAMMFL